MKFKSTLLVLSMLVAVAAVLLPLPAKAVDCGVIPQFFCNNLVENPNGTATGAIIPLVDFIANIMVGLFGAVVLLIVIVSGIQISASGGNEDAVKKGKENIFKAVTGLVLLLSFRAIMVIFSVAFSGVDTAALIARDPATQNPILAPGGVPVLIRNVINIASFFAGVVSVIFIIVGGIQYAGSGGGVGLKKAKKTITYAVAGLVISIAAYGILLMIQTALNYAPA